MTLFQCEKARITRNTQTSTRIEIKSFFIVVNGYIYKTFSMLGIAYGHYFQGIERVEVHENMACAYLSIKSSGSLAGLMDAALQSGMAVSLNNNQPGLMPFTLGAMTLQSEAALLQLKTARVYTQKLSLFRTNLMICNSDDIPLLTVVDLGVKPSLILKKAVESWRE